jgi:hypothetical protein
VPEVSYPLWNPSGLPLDPLNEMMNMFSDPEDSFSKAIQNKSLFYFDEEIDIEDP